jgi:transposase
MDGGTFLAYVHQFLCPTLQPGDTVILDNLSSHKVAGVEQAIVATGVVRFLPPYSPDLNPIGKLFSKLKARLRRAAKRDIEALWKEIGEVLNAVCPGECTNFFASCGYVSTSITNALKMMPNRERFVGLYWGVAATHVKPKFLERGFSWLRDSQTTSI